MGWVQGDTIGAAAAVSGCASAVGRDLKNAAMADPIIEWQHAEIAQGTAVRGSEKCMLASTAPSAEFCIPTCTFLAHTTLASAAAVKRSKRAASLWQMNMIIGGNYLLKGHACYRAAQAQTKEGTIECIFH